MTFDAGGGRIAGTVLAPIGPGPHPAAVMVYGAAGGQRDFCRLFARPVLDAGVAILIYDKAGHGQSEGDGDPTTFARADAASAGMDLLASLPDVDARRIGLVGFSNGMWAVRMLAARRHPTNWLHQTTEDGLNLGENTPGCGGEVANIHGVGLT